MLVSAGLEATPDAALTPYFGGVAKQTYQFDRAAGRWAAVPFLFVGNPRGCGGWRWTGAPGNTEAFLIGADRFRELASRTVSL